MRPIPLYATAAILVCWLVPLGLRTLSGRLEPYPALLLPSGASLMKTADTQVTVSRIQLWGRDAAQQWIALSSRRFLDPVPVQVLGALVRNDFGLHERSQESVFLLYLWRYIELPRKAPTVEARSEAKAWISERLLALDASADVLRVTTVQDTLEVPTGRLLSSVTTSERIYALD